MSNSTSIEKNVIETQFRDVVCSICIATFKRPDLLRKLLNSIQEQVLPENVSLEVIVIDNDVDQSGRSVVGKFVDRDYLKFFYFTQPVKNISITRNLSVQKASGDYILFIDDDEKADPHWIRTLLKTMRDFNADGVFGHLEPDFNHQTPAWMKRRDLFFYGEIRETGTRAEATYTGNCILKSSLIKPFKEPFDVSYGLTGGEDIKLFRYLSQQGAKFINCREAVVSEYLPPSRTCYAYFFKRAMSGGNRHTKWKIESSSNKLISRLFDLNKSICFGCISILLLILFFPNRVLRAKMLIKFGSNIGRFKAVFDNYYEVYR